jgi:hypothetical protein
VHISGGALTGIDGGKPVLSCHRSIERRDSREGAFFFKTVA